jgi:hypothetical protein
MATSDLSTPPQGTRIKVQKVKTARAKLNGDELLAQLCFLFPQYTLNEARRLPYKDVQLLLRVAQKQQATQLYNLTQVVAAPHTKKGEGVKKLSEHFKKIANS